MSILSFIFQTSPFIRTFNNSDYTYVKPSPPPEPNTVSTQFQSGDFSSISWNFLPFFSFFRTGEVTSPVWTLLRLRLYQLQVLTCCRFPILQYWDSFSILYLQFTNWDQQTSMWWQHWETLSQLVLKHTMQHNIFYKSRRGNILLDQLKPFRHQLNGLLTDELSKKLTRQISLCLQWSSSFFSIVLTPSSHCFRDYIAWSTFIICFAGRQRRQIQKPVGTQQKV